MSNDLIAFPQAMQLPAAFQGFGLGQELSENVGGTFAVLSMKGKVFGVKYGGDTEQLLVDYQGQKFAAPCIDVVLVKGNPNLSKTYYKNGYVEGSNESPDCSSEDGHVPNVATPVSARCDTCPMNAWGSRINNATGSKGKACSDTRKIAFLFYNDLKGDKYKGPILARITATNLSDLAEYQKALERQGIPYQAVITRITFDTNEAYPKFKFQAVGMLDNNQAQDVLKWFNDPRTAEVLTAGAASVAPVAALPPAVAQQPVPAAMQQQFAPPPVVAPEPAAVMAPPPSNVVQMPIQPPAPPAMAQAPLPPAPGAIQQPPPPQTFTQAVPVATGAIPQAPVPQPGTEALSGSLLNSIDELLGRSS